MGILPAFSAISAVSAVMARGQSRLIDRWINRLSPLRGSI